MIEAGAPAALGALAGSLRALLPPGMALAVRDPRAEAGDLHPEEARALGPMVPRRAREFAAGRRAARAAMAMLGGPPKPVPMGLDRAPVWPSGLAGAISHSATAAAAVLAPAPPVRGLGLDIEPEDGLAGDMIESFCGPAERDWLRAQPAQARPRLATLLFSAKECAYKCQYPLTGRLLGFEAFRVEVSPDEGRFRAILTLPVGPFAAGDALDGRCGFAGGHALTVIILPEA